MLSPSETIRCRFHYKTNQFEIGFLQSAFHSVLDQPYPCQGRKVSSCFLRFPGLFWQSFCFHCFACYATATWVVDQSSFSVTHSFIYLMFLPLGLVFELLFLVPCEDVSPIRYLCVGNPLERSQWYPSEFLRNLEVLEEILKTLWLSKLPH